jgi:COP9 signalosome complex subunit 2
MSNKNHIDYDPDAVDGDDDGFYDGGDDDNGGFASDGLDGGDNDFYVSGNSSEDGDGDGEVGFADTPEDKLKDLWHEAKDLKGEEKLTALESLVKEEKSSTGETTNEGFKAIKHIILVSYQLGKLDKITTWFTKWVDEYKVQMKGHLQAVPKLLKKMEDLPELPALVTLAFKNITDKLNKTKLLLIKASSMIKKNDQALNNDIIATLNEAHSFLKTSDGADDTENQANLLLELYSQKIMFADKRRNNKDLKAFFEKADALTGKAMGNNAVLGNIYSVGGRARMRERKFADASKFLVEAVKNWDQCRNKVETENCIKLMVVASLLSTSKVNPFDDQVAASHLGTASIKAFERVTKDVLTKNADSFLVNIKPLQREEIVKEYIPLLKRLIQKDLFLEVVKPYSNISMQYVGKRIHATAEETESIVVELILNQQLTATIDQASGVLNLDTTTQSYTDYYGNMHLVSLAVDKIQRNVLAGLS